MASWRLVNVEPIGRALEHAGLMLDTRHFHRLIDFIRDVRFEERHMDVCFGCSHYLSFDYEREIRDNYFLCGAGLCVASILHNGDIYGCLDIERRRNSCRAILKWTIWQRFGIADSNGLGRTEHRNAADVSNVMKDGSVPVIRRILGISRWTNLAYATSAILERTRSMDRGAPFCEVCGKEFKDDESFCSKCGAQRSMEQYEYLEPNTWPVEPNGSHFCFRCGCALAENSLACPSCGVRRNQNEGIEYKPSFSGGYPHLSIDYENRCENCHSPLNQGDRYCRICGTKRGEGPFEPYENVTVCIYGPMPVKCVHRCERCGYKWSTVLMVDDERYCPRCGGKATVHVASARTTSIMGKLFKKN